MDKTRIFETAGRFAAKGQLDKAAKEYQRVLEKDPKDVRALQKLAEIHQKNGKLSQASDLLLRVAEGYGEQGFFLKAVAVYKQILKFGNDERIDVNLKLAQLYQQLGLVGDATQQYQVVANHYDRQGNVRESLAAVRRMVDLDPDNVASRVKLGELYAREQMTGEAVAELKRAASYLRKNNRGDDQLRVLERIAQLAPDDAGVARELAQAYLPRGDTKRALARLQVCFRQNPRDVETLQLLARAFTDLGQAAKTVSVYRELAHVYAEGGQADLQRRTLEKLLELAPGDAEATESLQGLAGTAPEPSIEVADQPAPAVVTPPPPPAATSPAPAARAGVGGSLPPPEGTSPAVTKLLTETDVYLKYGLVPKAEDHLRKALVEHPGSIALSEKLVAVLDRREKPDEAAEVVARLVELARLQSDSTREGAYLQELGQRVPDHALVTAASAEADLGEIETDFDDLVIEPDETELEAAQLAAEAAGEGDPLIDGADLEPVLDDEIELAEDDDSLELDDDAPGVIVDLDAPGLDHLADDSLAGDSLSDVPLADVPRVDSSLDDDSLIDDALAGEEVVFESAILDDEPAALDEPEVVDDEPAALDDDWQNIEEQAVVVESFDEPVAAQDEEALRELAFDDATDVGDAWDEEEQAPPAAFVDETVAEEAFDADPVEEQAFEDDAAETEAGAFEEEIAEADFLIQQGLEEDARYALESILARAPEHPRAQALLLSLQSPEVTQPPGVSPMAAPARDDGFDLSAELADEFDSIERTPARGETSQPLSMDDVLGEFEARLPETIGAEDSQTHYDLGIAYKEMGMLDEAVHEFEVALGGRGTRRVIDCLTMLGICLAEKGQHEEAIARFQTALKTPGLTLEGSKEAHYQIGASREAQGRPKEAFGHLARVFKADPGFRDVKEKVQALQRQLREAPARRPQSDSLAVGRASLVPPTRPRPPSPPNEPAEGRPPAGGRGKIGYV